MNEEKNIHPFHASGEPPVSIPPVDEAWPLMKQKLDFFMPSIPWYKNVRHWRFVTAATVSAALTATVVVGVVQSRKANHRHPQTIVVQKDVENQTNQPNSQAGILNNPSKESTQPENTSGQTTYADTQTRSTTIGTTQGRRNAENIQTESETTDLPPEKSATPSETTVTHSKTTASHSETSVTHPETTATPSENIPVKPGAVSIHPGTSSTRSGTRSIDPATTSIHPSKRSNDPGITASGLTMRNKKNKGAGRLAEKRHQRTHMSQPGTAPFDAAYLSGSSVSYSPFDSNHSRGHHSLKRVPVYSAFSLDRTGTDYSSHPPRINDSVLRSDRSSGKEGIASGTAAPSASKTAILRHNKALQKKDALMSVGLTIGKSFPIGRQHSVPYNVNAGSNTLSDYIPAPYFRYAINDRMDLEAAFQFNNPQYTRSQTIDSTADSVLLSNQVDLQVKKLSLEKLYYANIPIILHYRVFGNLSLGAGLQYSRLWGGVGQQVSYLQPSSLVNAPNDSGRTSRTIALKNNAQVYGKLKKDDWRILVEASYAWRRFNIGIRYQRGLTPYLSVLPDGSKGKDKNSSLTLHLDYDLWQKRRRK